ncbi:Tn3 family transposase [Streptomyces sp. NPDC048606]|uniref:Tn3 family transposase n=1 Tax=Streptomyces sp. NPDC048606 TaxID=3154726 RepID=UPI00343DF218
MLALHLLQSALVHVNTLLVQQVLAEPAWSKKLSDEDRRGLTALFWSNVKPYGPSAWTWTPGSTWGRLSSCRAPAHLPTPPADHAPRHAEGFSGFVDRAAGPANRPHSAHHRSVTHVTSSSCQESGRCPAQVTEGKRIDRSET